MIKTKVMRWVWGLKIVAASARNNSQILSILSDKMSLLMLNNKDKLFV